MPKPKKERFVRFPPPVSLFRPIGIPSSQLCDVVLFLDEYEALRLVDHEGMDQAMAAEELGVSRATCARILESAHGKIADAIVSGCAIRIEGGNFRLGRNRYRCLSCGNVWESGFEAERPECPECANPNVVDLAARVGRGGGGGHGHGGSPGGPRGGLGGRRFGAGGHGGRQEGQ